mmetsp:Transcript_112474/g.216658  ORF Transcript_112474/g.216658 Transcript_112474/m.216658 type:complete len:259 (-) Transcript_112474:47-823(-)
MVAGANFNVGVFVLGRLSLCMLCAEAELFTATSCRRPAGSIASTALWMNEGIIQIRPASNFFFRHFATHTFSRTKRLPPRPPMMPNSRNNEISQLSHSFFGLFVGVEILKKVSWFDPYMFQLFNVKLAVKLPAKASSKARWLSARTDPSSSTANSTPPMGAPKAVETPAAAPTQISSCRGMAPASAPNGPPLVRNTYAQQTPICMRGPSLPSASPAPTTSDKPTVFIKRQTAEKLREIKKPDTAALTSGMPLPLAGGL